LIFQTEALPCIQGQKKSHCLRPLKTNNNYDH
jgi:hypothetical protein